jgi:hypothetical protein
LVPPQLASREVTPLAVELGADEDDARVDDPDETLLALVDETEDEVAGLLEDADVDATAEEELEDNPHLPNPL